MSMNRHSLHLAPRRSNSNPVLCARLLGEHVREIRLLDGRPLEELAPLVGLAAPEWERIEAGQAPDTWEQVCLIAMVLHLGRSWTPYLVHLWAGAKPFRVPGQ